MEYVTHEVLGGSVHDERAMFDIAADAQEGQVAYTTFGDLIAAHLLHA